MGYDMFQAFWEPLPNSMRRIITSSVDKGGVACFVVSRTATPCVVLSVIYFLYLPFFFLLSVFTTVSWRIGMMAHSQQLLCLSNVISNTTRLSRESTPSSPPRKALQCTIPPFPRPAVPLTRTKTRYHRSGIMYASRTQASAAPCAKQAPARPRPTRARASALPPP